MLLPVEWRRNKGKKIFGMQKASLHPFSIHPSIHPSISLLLFFISHSALVVAAGISSLRHERRSRKRGADRREEKRRGYT